MHPTAEVLEVQGKIKKIKSDSKLKCRKSTAPKETGGRLISGIFHDGAVALNYFSAF